MSVRKSPELRGRESLSPSREAVQNAAREAAEAAIHMAEAESHRKSQTPPHRPVDRPRSRSPMHSKLKFRKKCIFVGRKMHFLTFSKVQKNIFCYFKKWDKIHFCTKKMFKTMKNAIFGLKKRQEFWTKIILFSTFQVTVQRRIPKRRNKLSFLI